MLYCGGMSAHVMRMSRLMLDMTVCSSCSEGVFMLADDICLVYFWLMGDVGSALREVDR